MQAHLTRDQPCWRPDPGGLWVAAPVKGMLSANATVPSLPQLPNSRAGGDDMTPTRCYSSLVEQRERRGDVHPCSKHPRYEPRG